ncbi:Os12g0150700 [Oryza sativa Japonica Group]|uniref:Purple acid phosphatase n=1 Tax=Oryza sativa subsp. japonica TaxID=39947 RepID=A0A0P0Y702_ORYSJ|nr:hypothetical protein EE612_057821 [Oryza sativa]BAT15912.1 Os12g0150700 [Oryza sativa Japonica Group]
MANSGKKLMDGGGVAFQTLPRAAGDDNADDDYVRPPPRPLVSTVHDKPATHPQQVHISVVGANRMRICWVTDDDDGRSSPPSVVEYGTSPGEYTASATGDHATYSYSDYKSGAIHHVTIGPLEPATTYYYRCGAGEEEELSLRTPPAKLPVEFVVIGDVGQTEWTAATLSHIGEKDYDVALVAGDLSYADGKQPLWDSFGRLVQPLASARPWMVTEGNHEKEKTPGSRRTTRGGGCRGRRAGRRRASTTRSTRRAARRTWLCWGRTPTWRSAARGRRRSARGWSATSPAWTGGGRRGWWRWRTGRGTAPTGRTRARASGCAAPWSPSSTTPASTSSSPPTSTPTSDSRGSTTTKPTARARCTSPLATEATWTDILTSSSRIMSWHTCRSSGR